MNQREIEISGLAYGGSGVGRIDGKVYFIEGALPGEKVRFNEAGDKKKFAFGIVTEITTASPDRVKPPCPYYDNCGGCQYQHLSYEKEIYYKSEQIKEIFSRIGGFKEFTLEKPAPSSSQYGYRSSVTLHNSEAGYGFFGRDNKTFVSIERCLLASDQINNFLKALPASGKRRKLTIKCDKPGNVWVSHYSGHRFFKDEFLGTQLTFSPLAFSQVNREIALAIVEKLRTWIKEDQREMLLELYCGVGFFGLLMRDLFEQVIGIDSSSIAIDCAQASKKALHAENIKFYCGEAGERLPFYYEKLRGRINTVLLDPPRFGISERLTGYLAEAERANSIYYISCDPAMLARDARRITKKGAWRLDRVIFFDMFPRTKHIESIAVFKR